jgi:uncharacterized protein (DUF433 family)
MLGELFLREPECAAQGSGARDAPDTGEFRISQRSGVRVFQRRFANLGVGHRIEAAPIMLHGFLRGRGGVHYARESCYRGSQEAVMTFMRITVKPDQMDGAPCIRGLRIPVATVVGMAADGMSDAEILAAYPDLERDDIREALRYAANAVRERELPLAVP